MHGHDFRPELYFSLSVKIGSLATFREADFSGRIVGWDWGCPFGNDLEEDGKRLVKTGGGPPVLVASWQVTGVTHSR